MAGGGANQDAEGETKIQKCKRDASAEQSHIIINYFLVLLLVPSYTVDPNINIVSNAANCNTHYIQQTIL